MLQLLIRGFVLGFSVAWPPGPINAEVIRRALTRGAWPALALGLGAGIGDFLWALVVGSGIAAIVDRPFVRPALGIISVCLLLYLAYTYLREAYEAEQRIRSGKEQVKPVSAESTRAGFMLGFTLAIVSPFNIAFWLAVLGGQATNGITFLGSLTLAIAVVGGSITWDIILCSTLRYSARYSTPRWELVTCAITGLLMLGFAVKLGLQLVAGIP